MTTDIATIEPQTFMAGDTLKWKKTLSDYPANDGWVLSYALRGAAQINITATADGADHLVSVAAASTTAYTAGHYRWTASVSKSGERYTVGTGYVTISENLATATTYTDRVLTLRTDITAINGFLAKNYKYSSYSIGGRSLASLTPTEVFGLRDRLQRELNDLLNAENIKAGLGSNKIVRVRFSS